MAQRTDDSTRQSPLNRGLMYWDSFRVRDMVRQCVEWLRPEMALLVVRVLELVPAQLTHHEHRGNMAAQAPASPKAEKPEPVVDDKIRSQVLQMLGAGYARVDIRNIYGKTYRINGWVSIPTEASFVKSYKINRTFVATVRSDGILQEIAA